MIAQDTQTPLHPLPLCSGLDKWSQSPWGLRIPVWNEYTHAHSNSRTGIRPLLHSCVQLGSSPVVLPSAPKLPPSSKGSACLSYASLPLLSSESQTHTSVCRVLDLSASNTNHHPVVKCSVSENNLLGR